jgi:hypothetical protein
MKFAAVFSLGLAGLVAQPALAQGQTGAPKTTQASIESLLAAGYEIKAITALSDAAIKEIWPGQSLQSQLVVTLQKANSVAVCAIATGNWVSLADATMATANLCSTR